MRIDAHQHFWEYHPEEYPWITEELGVLRRSFLPSDLAPELIKSGLDGSIAVQARQSLDESRWLLSLAEKNSHILGVVGWVDLCSDHIDAQLAEFSGHPQFVGVRHVVQDEPDDSFMLRTDFLNGIDRLKNHGLKYDILIFPQQLEAALKLVAQFPEQAFVIDHIGKPSIKDGSLQPWKKLMKEFSEFPNVNCKISGMITEADWKNWKKEDMKPYLETVMETFAPSRLMYGSDWPVCLLAGDYCRVIDLATHYINQLSTQDQDLVFGGTAAQFYNI
ncbi:MAG TPA: amidohydrolase [Verrucomicrobiales bacterium]|nr:amidohydrolase [Verrucomicrobiales bacterium]